MAGVRHRLERCSELLGNVNLTSPSDLLAGQLGTLPPVKKLVKRTEVSVVPEHALRWIAGLLLAALLAVAWFQQRWLEQLHAAQVERRVAALSSSLVTLREAFDHHFFSWALGHELALARLVDQPDAPSEALDDLDGTVVARFYRHQRSAGADIWFRLQPDGTSMALDGPPEILRNLPSPLGSLVPVAVGPDRLVVLLAEILPVGGLDGAIREAGNSEGSAGTLESPGPVMLIVLDRPGFMARVLEPIAERTLPLWATTLDYAVIERRAASEQMVLRSMTDLAAEDLVHADGETQLLRPETVMHLATQFVEAHEHPAEGICPDCGFSTPVGLGFLAGGEAAPQWWLRVRVREGAMTGLIDRLRVRNLWISAAGVAILGSAIVLLVVLTARAQRLARTQMEFVSSVSHELRTPLAVIGSAASNLAGGLVEGREQVRQYGDVLSQETRRLKELIERVLTFAKLDEGGLDVVAVDVTAVVERVVAGQRTAILSKDLALEIAVPADLPAVQANATALESALRNLLDNAIRHGGSGGRLRIEAEVEATGAGNELRLSVQDWGDGIGAAERKRLFEPFFRGRRARERQIPGTGLGLSLVSRIVAALDGRVQVRAVRPRGTIFDLFLPLALSSGSSG